jgi:RimJ/RimL family protein N-acetyltransferase
MEQYPKRVTLRSGASLTLRPLTEADEAALLRFFGALPQESTQYLKEDVRAPEAVLRHFFRERDPERDWSVIALLDDGRIVGEATLHADRHGWRRHVGEVRVVVDPGMQKQRLATTLIHELVNQASVRGLRKLEAQILHAQAGARAAFDHLGFREEARLVGHALDHLGSAHDLLLLTVAVDDLWRKMENLITDMELRPYSY